MLHSTQASGRVSDLLGQRIVGTERHNADSAVEYAACYMRRGGTLPVSNFLCTGNFLLADIQA